MTDPDLVGLRRILAERLDADVTDAVVVADGLNRIVVVSTADGRYVVRRPNMLRGTYYMIDLRTEYEVLEALADTPVPAPRPVLFEAYPSALGGPFLVCPYLDGETVPLGSDRPER
jgi:aminoglycoside phosphotransferase (APT) family kinase protein